MELLELMSESGIGLLRFVLKKERMVIDMNTTEKIKVLEERLQKLSSSEKENYGVCRKI